MSTYYDPRKNSKSSEDFNPMTLDAPSYVRKFLTALYTNKNCSFRTIYNYHMTLRSYLIWLNSDGKPERNENSFVNIDTTKIPFKLVAEADEDKIFNFISYCATTLKNNPTTRANKMAAIRRFYNYWTDRKYMDEQGNEYCIKTDPTAKIEISFKSEKKLPKILTLDDVKKLVNIDTYNGTPAHPAESPYRDRCIIVFFLALGIRLSELVNIDMGDIIIGADTASLLVHGKGNKERKLHLSSFALEAYHDYLPERIGYGYERKEHKDPLFISPRTGNRLTPRAVEQMVEKKMLTAGLEPCSPHKLRHTAATLMYQLNSSSLMEIRDILGHTNTAVTEIYAHTSDKLTAKALDGLGDILSAD